MLAIIAVQMLTKFSASNSCISLYGYALMQDFSKNINAKSLSGEKRLGDGEKPPQAAWIQTGKEWVGVLHQPGAVGDIRCPICRGREVFSFLIGLEMMGSTAESKLASVLLLS